jgi:hypothetical protein
MLGILLLPLVFSFAACSSPPVDLTKDLDPPPTILAGLYSSLEQQLQERAQKDEAIEPYFGILVVNGKIRAAVEQLERMKATEPDSPVTKICEKFLEDSIKAPDFQARNDLFVKVSAQITTALGDEVQKIHEQLQKDFKEFDDIASSKSPKPTSLPQPVHIEPNFSLMWEKAKEAVSEAIKQRELQFPKPGDYTIEHRGSNRYVAKGKVFGMDSNGQRVGTLFFVELEQLPRDDKHDDVKVIRANFDKARAPQDRDPKADNEIRKRFIEALHQANKSREEERLR